MSLWDGLTGKIWSWNKLWDKADEDVGCELNSWIASEFPDITDSTLAIHTRDHVYAHYTAARIYLCEMASSPSSVHTLNGVNLKERLFGLHLRSLLVLLRCLHSYSAIVHVIGNHDESNVAWTQLQLTAINQMYSCPAGYIDAWVERIEFFSDEESGGIRIGIYMYDQIAEILGMPSWNKSNPLLTRRLISYWMQTAANIVRCRDDLCRSDRWSAKVVEELSRASARRS